MEKIYGERTCQKCHGICHDGSLRKKYGIRKRYYCGKNCLKNEMDARLQLSMRKEGHPHWRTVEWSVIEFDKFVADYFEQVDVITA